MKFLPGYVSLCIALCAGLLASGVYFLTPLLGSTSNTSPLILEAEEIAPSHKPYPYTGKHIIVYLDARYIELRDGERTVATTSTISVGKPGSYYETPAGSYTSEYKVRNHFSSITHVYMPYSVHFYGNYFIHGVPTYPDGTELHSAYSGGCIRVPTDEAAMIYSFVEKNTPVLVVRKSIDELDADTPSTATTSLTMTRDMVAVTAMEFLNQYSPVMFEGKETTHSDMLAEYMTSGDDRIAERFADDLGRATFISRMNERARALGLMDTTFTSVTSEAATSVTNLARFNDHLTINKSYITTRRKY